MALSNSYKLQSFSKKLDYFIGYWTGQVMLKMRKITKPQMVSLSGIKIPIPPNVSQGPLEALYAGYYERSELKILKTKLCKDDCVMELGTGLGLLSSYCANKLGSDRVYTYEANPALEPLIHKTYALNNVNSNLNICLLGKSFGEQEFFVSKSFWSSSTIPLRDDYQAVIVPVIPFNHEIRKNNPTVLIVDIEGGEYELFKDADLHNVKKIIMEIHPGHIGGEKSEFVKNKLIQQGFCLDQQVSYRNELFFYR